MLRHAAESDVPRLEELIRLSVHSLQAPYYTVAQRAEALGPVFAVDRQLIADGTYFVAEGGSGVVGCGGWSKRKSHFGGDVDRTGVDPMLNPAADAARVRAFFTHPGWARRGIGKAILSACEDAILAAGFTRVEMVATLAGEPLYLSCGYQEKERYSLHLRGDQTMQVVRMTKVFSQPPRSTQTLQPGVIAALSASADQTARELAELMKHTQSTAPLGTTPPT